MHYAYKNNIEEHGANHVWLEEKNRYPLFHDKFQTLEKCEIEKSFFPRFQVSKRAVETQSIAERFQELAAKWKEETGAYSTTIHKIANPSYREIINMGSAVIPFILTDLQNSTVWFTALRELAKENPIMNEHAGNSQKIREAWIQWGKNKGLI